MPVTFRVNDDEVSVDDDGSSLLEVLRDQLGIHSAKDGCSPQGQCGCCTVLVDGAPRVACVTPARRVAGRSITTLEGLPVVDRNEWGDAFCATGASQCGFCTPGIILRLVGLRDKGVAGDDEAAVCKALAAHLCRCTGWRTIIEAYEVRVKSFSGDETPGPIANGVPSRDLGAAERRAAIEGGVPQQVGAAVACGAGGYADDVAPADALVAVSDGAGGRMVAETLAEARTAAGKVQGRRSTIELRYPLEVPDACGGDWVATLRTTWVEPAYLETDASWCEPGGEPFSPLANGGAFGGKISSIVMNAARELADRYGHAVRVLLSREDAVRLGAKRPPIAAGVRVDGSGVMRVVSTPGVADMIASVASALVVDEFDVAGPSTSVALRGAGWAEAAVLLSALHDEPLPIVAPNGAIAEAVIRGDASIHVRVSCGDPLDAVVLRSYCIGAAHMALGWVTSEGIAVDEAGDIHDLTIRSFGIVRPSEMPAVEVEIVPPTSSGSPEADPVNGSDAVFAAVAAAVWRHQGFPPDWPTRIPLRGAKK